MLKCLNCGAEVDESELESYEEFAGYYGEARAYETFYRCPHCHADEDEMVEMDSEEYYDIIADDIIAQDELKARLNDGRKNDK